MIPVDFPHFHRSILLFTVSFCLLAEMHANDDAEGELDADALMEQWLRMEDPDDPGIPELEDLNELTSELEALLEPIPLWDLETRLTSGAGYRDNIQLSAAAREDAPFLLGGIESTLSRISTTGASLAIGLDAEHLRFLSASGSLHDTYASAFVQTRIPVTSDSHLILPLVAFYLDQVIDPSTTDVVHEPMPIRVHGFTLTPALRTDWEKTIFTEVAFAGGRHLLDDPFSDYWEFGPKLTIGSAQGRNEMAASIQYLVGDIDDRQAISVEDGQTLPNTKINITRLRPEASLRRTWGESDRWRTRSRVGLEFHRDDATGYFDYDRFRLSQDLGYRTELWDIKAQLQYSYYRYENQRVQDDDRRKRHSWGAGIEVRRLLLDSLDVFASYDWETVDSNETGTDYSVNTWAAGLGWRF